MSASGRGQCLASPATTLPGAAGTREKERQQCETRTSVVATSWSTWDPWCSRTHISALPDAGIDAECTLLPGQQVERGVIGKEAGRFVDLHAAEPAKRPTWLFASGSIVGAPPPADDPDALRPGLAEKLVAKTGAHEHKLFGGKVDMRKLGMLEKAAVRGAHATEGDYRAWHDIDEWAAGIARQLGDR
jgi:hypothetical protein